MPTHAFTIGKLAREAGVTIETIRYWQSRGLIAEPARAPGRFRHYDEAALAAARFVRRALALGFALDDAAELLQLRAGADRAEAQRVALARARQIEARIADLRRLADGLVRLAEQCAADKDGLDSCPVLAALDEGTPLVTAQVAP